jgi:hypothetical protein
MIEKLRNSVDRFIIGSVQYCDVLRAFYAKSTGIGFMVQRKQDQLL